MTTKKQPKGNKTMTTPKAPSAAPPVAAPTTVGSQIWDEIKDKEVLMFSIPNQFVNQYCEPVALDPSKCFLKYKVSAFIPALEEAIGANKKTSKYNLEVHGDYIVVSRNNVLGQ